MRAAKPKANSEQHQLHPGILLPSSRPAVAAAMMAAMFFACPSARADGAADIKSRIEAAFALMPSDLPELSFQLTRRALLRRSVGPDGGAAQLSYAETGAEMLAPQMAALESQAAGLLGSTRFESGTELARLPRPRPEPGNAIITGSIAPPASTSEAEFFGRFAGSFSGSGQVRRSANASPNQVQCMMTGQPSENRIAISGRCGIGMFSREISADIRYDPASGRYSGTYVGASVGPAQLSGTRHGDAVVLTIRWPKPVNGDTKATMTIRNSGNRQLAIVVTDEFQPGGARTEVTQLALNQI